MSWLPTADAETDRRCPDGVEMVILPRASAVGGFEVRRALPFRSKRMVGPFIFWDQMGPGEFLSGRGIDVRPHPHIGLTTVTYLLNGSIDHRDSLGNDLRIQSGDVNLMTAGAGIVHSERTGEDIRRRPSSLFGVQSWLAQPRSQEEGSRVRPCSSERPLTLDEPGISGRLILGEFLGVHSPVVTQWPALYVDVCMKRGAKLGIPATTEERAIYTLVGHIEVGGVRFPPQQMLILRPGDDVTAVAHGDVRLLILGGAVIRCDLDGDPDSLDAARAAAAGPIRLTSSCRDIRRVHLLRSVWVDGVERSRDGNRNTETPNTKETSMSEFNNWMIDPDDAVMLLIDHQSGLFQLVKDIELPVLRSNVIALAKVARLAKVPTFTTASVPDGPNGPLIPEIHQQNPEAVYIPRTGQVNAWDNPPWVDAIEKTGRKTLLIAGTLTSVCMAFPALSAVVAGYKVFCIIDASGNHSQMATDLTLARITQAGAMPIDTFAVLGELMSTWNRPDAMDFAAVMVDLLPHYRALMESYDKAQSVQRDGHETMLDKFEAGAGEELSHAR